MTHYYIQIKVKQDGTAELVDTYHNSTTQWLQFTYDAYVTVKSDLPLSKFREASYDNIFRRDQYPARTIMSVPDTDIKLYMANINHVDWHKDTDFSDLGDVFNVGGENA